MSNLLPKKPLLEKPVLNDTFYNSNLPKPKVTQAETPLLKMSEPQIIPAVPTTKLNKIPAPKVTKYLKKPKIPPTNSPERSLLNRSLPKLIKDPVPLSPFTSKKSRLIAARLTRIP